MGLLDGMMGGGGGLLGLSPQAFGTALMAASGPSRMPHGLLSDFGNAAMNAQQVQGQQYQNAIQQMQLPMLAQRYQLMQDAMTGTGAFGGGQSGPSPQDASQAALSQGGGPSVQNAATMDNMLRGGGQQNSDVLRRALIMEQLIPGAGKAMLEKNMPGFQNLREGSALFDPGGHIVAQNPRAPQNTILNQGPGGQYSVSPLPGALPAQTANEAIPFQLKNLFDFGIPPGGGGSGAGAGAGAGGPVPPQSSPASAPILSQGANGDLTTPKGTIVPATKGNQVMGPGTDLISKQNTESIATEKNWAAVRPQIETARSRLAVMSDAFQSLDTKGFTEGRADVSNKLRGLGLDSIANAVMSAKDTSSVQQVLWSSMQDVMSTLKTLNAGTGGRILNSEFQAFMEHSFNPDMMGSALHSAVTQQLGSLYQTQNMIDDYRSIGRQRGWRDANQFQSAYLQKNPIEGFVKYAEQTTPPFRGMPGNPNDNPQGGQISAESMTKASSVRADFLNGKITRDAAIKQLKALGFND